MKKELKKEFLKLDKLEKIANRASDEWDANPESTECEKAFDEAYKNEFNQFISVSELISEFTGIDVRTSRMMVNWEREKLMKMLNQ